MLPRGKKIRYVSLRCHFLHLRSKSMENSGGFFPQTFSLSKHNMINEEIDRHESMPRLNAKFPQSQGNPVHFRTKMLC